MKLASFFLISAAFHAAVLAFSVSFLEMGGGQMIPVVLLDGGGDSGQGTAGGSGVGREKMRGSTTSQRHAGVLKSGRQIVSRVADPKEKTDEGNVVPLIAQESFLEGIASTGLKDDGEVRGVFVEGAAGIGKEGKSGGRENSGGGIGNGGLGGGRGSPGLDFARAGYASNPKPEYPERARREGWEGTVLLRVLVDEEGKSKSIEVSRSSGFEALDQAAVKTVKGWRFYPARYGEMRVESWVKIPIVFSLSDRDHGS